MNPKTKKKARTPFVQCVLRFCPATASHGEASEPETPNGWRRIEMAGAPPALDIFYVCPQHAPVFVDFTKG